MNQDYDTINGEFQHVILEGSAYEVGRMQGEILKKNKQMRKRIEETVSGFLAQLGGLSSGKPDLERMGFQNSRELEALFDECSPELNEEMKGFADSLGVKANEMPFYSATYYVPNKCSQMAALSSVTNDEHVYVGRSYEWIHTEEDLRLCTTRVKGKARHIGFSTFLFGRADGMNEHGVGVSFTGGGIFGVPLKQRGFHSHLIIRAILDNCKSVDDSIELIQRLPISGFFNLLIVDRNSNAVLAEFADGTCDIKQIDNYSKDKYLFSTNHYTLPSTLKSNEHNCGIIENSQKRYQLIASTLKKASPEISKEILITILSKKFPEGVCDHFYTDYFGTIWSMIFDLTCVRAEVCFGAPTHNGWQLFTLDEPVGIKKYQAVFPNTRSKWSY